MLGAFLDGERIVRLPARQKKRKVILRWLLEAFEPGRTYDQFEVNEIIKRHHPDCAAIRREWIEFGFMNRDGRTYWRTDLRR